MDLEKLISMFGECAGSDLIVGLKEGTYLWYLPDGVKMEIDSKENMLFQLGFTDGQKALNKEQLIDWLGLGSYMDMDID